MSLYWLIARCWGGREDMVLSWAVRRGFRSRGDIYFPRGERVCRSGPARSREARAYPVMPGYIFVSKDRAGELTAAPNVLGWLGFGGATAQIEYPEIMDLIRREDAGEFRQSDRYRAVFEPKVGDMVTLEGDDLVRAPGHCFVTVALLKGDKVELDGGIGSGLLRRVVVDRGRVAPAQTMG